jgi:hypothetical protein
VAVDCGAVKRDPQRALTDYQALCLTTALLEWGFYEVPVMIGNSEVEPNLEYALIRTGAMLEIGRV